MNPNEIWQAEVNGQIYDAAFSELAAWVGESALLPGDKVRRRNLRWLEAGKVPALMPFFNAKEIGIAPPEIPVSATDGENADAEVQINTANFAPDQIQPTPQKAEVCVLHGDTEAEFVCETCFNNFCKMCPQDVGDLGKICSMCGALVKSIVGQTQNQQPEEFLNDSELFFEQQPQQFKLQTPPPGSFGFGDFGRALAYPLKYKVSLVFGTLMYMFFTLGQQAYTLGGALMIFAAIFAAMLANMLTFGVLANVIENFSQGKTGTNFMPDFDDFSIWDDVIHPFFLSIGVYLVSFGLFLAIVIGGGWYMVGSIQSEMQTVQQNSTSTVLPGITREMDKLSKTPQTAPAQNEANTDYDEQQQYEKLQKMIEDARRSESETIAETSSQVQMNKIGRKVVQKAFPLVILAGLAFLWGLFYFPAACAVAGYTRSFAATMDPRIGWDTIKNLGSDYAQILLMMFIISIASIVAAAMFHIVFSAFTLPQFGNIPALAATSWISFYFWTVFSCVLGYAIGKKSDKLGIYRG